jgi:Leucine-rich repeat (LRR) protein
MTNLRGFIRLVIVLFLFFLSSGQIQIAFAQCETVSEIPVSECEALVSLYNSTGGDSWSDNSGWLISTTPCSWYGVGCQNGHVTDLDFHQNWLSGSIPSELGNLADLQSLSFQSNQLSGGIPSQLGNLANLQYLHLGGNQLSGSIPSQLGNLDSARPEIGKNELSRHQKI